MYSDYVLIAFWLLLTLLVSKYLSFFVINCPGHQLNCTAFPRILQTTHLHSVIITHTWPPSGNPPHLLPLIKVKLHSFQTLIVWSRGYKLFVCLFTNMLDLCGCLPPVDSTKGREGQFIWASLYSDLLHLTVEVAFSWFNKEAYFTHPRLPLHPVCDRRPDQHRTHRAWTSQQCIQRIFSSLSFRIAAPLRTMWRNI